MATSAEATAEFPGEYQHVFDAVCRGLKAERLTILQADAANGFIQVESNMTAMSWGEHAEVRVATVAPGTVTVTVRSKLKFGLVDWGKNRKNVDKIMRSIGSHVAQPASPAGWHPDPTGRHQHRYWDGARWTDHVSDAGVTASDPIDA